MILLDGVRPAMVTAEDPAASQYPARERGSHQVVVVDFFVARSLPGIGYCPSVRFDPFRIGFGIADPSIPVVGLSAVAGLDPAAADLVAVGFAADLAAIADFVDSAFVVCPSAAVMGKATAAVAAASCSSARRSSSLRNRNFPSPLYFAARA